MFSKKIKLSLVASAVLALTACGESKTENTTSEVKPVTQDVSKADSNSERSLVLVQPEQKVFAEGTHYTKLEKPFVKPKNSVIELFSFTCPHCRNAEETLMTEWKKDKSVKFDIGHAVFELKQGDKSRLVWADVARLYFVLEKLDRLDLTMAFFNAVQDRANPFNDLVIEKIAQENGINAAKFFSLRDSVEADAYIKKSVDMSMQTGSQSVPTFVVSGKYLINLQSIKSFADVKEISEFLIREQP